MLLHQERQPRVEDGDSYVRLTHSGRPQQYQKGVKRVEIGRGIWPIAKTVDESVFSWVAVDVRYEIRKVAIVVHENAAKGLFEQAAGALVRLVERFGVSAEQVGEGVACLQGPAVVWWAGLAVLDSHEKMEMVRHQAVGVGLGDGFDVVGVQLEKVGIVALLPEQSFATVAPTSAGRHFAAIVDVIVLAVPKWFRL
jgi:hypothetical protein